MLRTGAIVATTVALLGPVSAQTAEETAAYIIFGVEDGAAVVSNGETQFQFEEISKSPLIFRTKDVKEDFKYVQTYRVERTDDCRFTITWEAVSSAVSPPATDIDVTTADFSRANEEVSIASENGDKKLVYPSAKIACQVVKNENQGACSAFDHFGSEQRVRKAVAYMRAKFCPGSAF